MNTMSFSMWHIFTREPDNLCDNVTENMRHESHCIILVWRYTCRNDGMICHAFVDFQE